MAVTEQPSSTFAALTERELEVLRLLTAGHTIKSISARLGRSEASIHERLRDARRKTGVGSSRELARLIAGQKNWDRNSDLPSLADPADEAEAPGETGLAKPKGRMIMLLSIPLAVAALAMAADQTDTRLTPEPAAEAAASRFQPFVGKWSLDVDRLPAEERPQRVTFDFRVSSDGIWTTEVEIVGGDGSIRRGGATGPANGNPVPLTGNVVQADTVSVRQPAADTLVMTFVKDGAPLSTRVYTVSKDRKSMTETIVWAGSSEPRMVTTYFNRVG